MSSIKSRAKKNKNKTISKTKDLTRCELFKSIKNCIFSIIMNFKRKLFNICLREMRVFVI